MRLRKIFLAGLLIISIVKQGMGQAKTDSLLQNILSGDTSKIVQDILTNRDSFRVQIIYTQINRDDHNRPSLKNYCFNVDTNLYFYPASTVKLPLALLSLEKLHELNRKAVNKFTSLQIDSSEKWETAAHYDSTAETNLPSIAQYIRKAFLISDNDAYNRMYQFVGQETINRRLHAKGYEGIRIIRQFLGLSAEQNRHTNAVRFIYKNGSLIYTQPPAYNPDSFYFKKKILVGREYLNSKDSLIKEPMDFGSSNYIPLEDLQQMLQSVLFPQTLPAGKRFNLGKDDYRFLLQYLSQYPSETNYPKYDSSEYYDSYVKFSFRQDKRQMPSYIRVFNKVGWAYGFLTDVSYVADFKNHIEYMLTATVYVNRDGIVNDDNYDYENTGWPFLKELGENIYQYELKRPRVYKPNLSNFKMDYEHRNINDKRPAVKGADN